MRYEREESPLDSVGNLVLPAADALTSDEPVFMLAEYDMPDEKGTGMYRWQLIQVERGDRLYDFPRKLGPSSDFTSEGFIWFCDGEKDTVDKMMDLAEQTRHRNSIQKLMDSRAGEESLFDQFITLEDQKQELIKRNYRTLRSRFGLRTV